ncbi:unnamed protein product [Lampetra planeri]
MSKKAAKKRNLPVDFSNDENNGDIVLATAPDTADQPEDLLPPVQEGERGDSPVRPPTKDWRDIAAHLERTLSAVTYLTTATQATTLAVALTDAPTLPATSTKAIAQEAAAISRAEAAPAISFLAMVNTT